LLKNLVYFVETSAAEPEYAMMHALSANLELPEMHQYSPQSAYLVIPPPLRPLSPISSQVPPIPSQLPHPLLHNHRPLAASLNHAAKKRKVSPQDVRKCRLMFLEKTKLELEIENIRLSNKKRAAD
jgi:hypothetical protein